MTVKELRDALANLPDNARVVMHIDDLGEDWLCYSTTYSPEPEVVPGTRGRVERPTFRLHAA